MVTLLGRVNRNVFKKLDIAMPSSLPNRAWFFADYCISEIPVSTSFDILLEGENKKLLLPRSRAKIITVIDQFGHKLPSIPEGFKIICRIEFNPHIPAAVKKLPLLNQWQYNPLSISLAQHEGIEVGISGTIPVSVYNIAYNYVKEAARKTMLSKNPTKIEFLEITKQSLDTNTEESERLLQTFLQLGKIRQKNDELELEEV